jgi:hypothetical protein
VICPVGERQWEDINWNEQGHRSCVNMELETFCCLLYPDMVFVRGRRVATRSWIHCMFRQYADQGSFLDVVVKMFWLNLVDNFQILIIFYFNMRI